jgi:hypothetical protein
MLMLDLSKPCDACGKMIGGGLNFNAHTHFFTWAKQTENIQRSEGVFRNYFQYSILFPLTVDAHLSKEQDIVKKKISKNINLCSHYERLR